MEVKTAEQQYNTTSSRIHMIRAGAIAGFPIFLGYLPIAITYGVLASQAGLSIFELTMMSVLVFAGASQFMGAQMIMGGSALLEIVVATFVLNFRHFVMSLSFMNRLKPLALKPKLALSLGLTDETFTVSSLHPKEAKMPHGALFYGSLILVSYFSWVGGSFLGGVLGEVIPDRLSLSMGIALYAMFIGLLVPSVKKEWRIGVIAIISMLINYVFILNGVSEGWSVVFATVIASFFGIFLLREEGAA